MICATEGEMTQICGYLEACKTRYLWAKVRDAVAQTLDTMTLADLVGASEAEVAAAPQFISITDIHVANPAVN
jgi:DNA-binding IscR family transcriptional regulator